MKWVGWGVGKFFQAVFNGDGRALDHLVDSDPDQWGRQVAGYRVEDPAQVLGSLPPADTAVLIFAVERAEAIRAAVARFGPFPTLAVGQLVRATSPHWSDYHARRDMSLAAWEQGTQESARFVRRRMKGAKPYWDPLVMLRDMVEQATRPGLVLEFGVATGTTTRALAAATSREVYGFDSFQGLPEAWGMVHDQGAFRQDPPTGLGDNVQLVVGLFEDTLPAFLEAHPGPVSFLHVDSDLYSSAKTIFRHLAGRIGPGTVIVFDDYLNYPDWQEHEHKAFMEYVAFSQCRFEYVGVVMNAYQVAVRILPEAP